MDVTTMFIIWSVSCAVSDNVIGAIRSFKDFLQAVLDTRQRILLFLWMTLVIQGKQEDYLHVPTS